MVLPTRSSRRLTIRQNARSRWCAARWINVLVEKHAWLSTGLIWLLEAPETGRPPKVDDHEKQVESVSVISLCEFWEQGVQLVRTLDAHRFHFPCALGVMNPWNFESKALSLTDALGVSEDSLTLALSGVRPYVLQS